MHYSEFIGKKLPASIALKFMNLVLNLSPKNLVRILDLLKTLARNEWQERGFTRIREMILENHGCVGAAQRISRQLSSKTKRRIFENFVVKGMLEGYDRRYAFYEEYGFGPPPVLAISPTSRCNLDCYGCYSAGHDETTELTYEEIDHLIEQAKAIGTNLIMLTGGEPFMRKELIFRLIEKHTDMAFQIYTNSLLLKEEDLLRLVKASNTSLAISVEGLEEETDRRRGKGAFAKIAGNMERIKKLGGLVAFSVTATSENMDEVLDDRFIQTMIDLGCLYGWYLMYIPVGTKTAIELMPTPAQRIRLTKSVKELRRKYPILLGMFWNDGNILEGCMSPKKYMHVNSRGDVEPCVFTHYSTHNIKEHSFVEVLDSPFFHMLRDRHPFNPDHRRPCPVIDNPHIYREIMEKIKPMPTEPEADKSLIELGSFFDQYSEEYGRLLEEEESVSTEKKAATA
ncbi:MAG: radical SAM protein [Deltaproteobacteria bacterium]|nr:radical SAM protein [Deltaproteobacteria bacterium]